MKVHPAMLMKTKATHLKWSDFRRKIATLKIIRQPESEFPAWRYWSVRPEFRVCARKNEGTSGDIIENTGARKYAQVEVIDADGEAPSGPNHGKAPPYSLTSGTDLRIPV